MHKNHYTAIAEIMRQNMEAGANGPDCEKNDGFMDAIEIVSSELADYLALDNARFNRAMFLQACGL